MDFADHATEREDIYRQEALQRARRAMPSGPSALKCAECGELIPESRRVALPGVQLCLECQEEREHERF